jgi:1,2-diacylglycerol 3-alpha-glucosyltransferase
MISDVYFPRVNGVSTSIQTFRNDLDALGCESWLIAPDYGSDWTDDARLRRARGRAVPFDPEDRLMSRRAVERACRDLEGRYDLVHIQTPFAAHRVGVRLARRYGFKTVETCHTHFEEYFHCYLPFVPRALLRSCARAMTRRQCNAVDAVVAPSEPMADVLRGYGVRAPVHVVPTGLDVGAFAAGDGARFRAAHGIEAHRPVMLHVGRVAFEKNIDFLIGVLGAVRQRVPDVLLVLAGEGPAQQALKRRVAALGLGSHVLFVGYLDRRSALLDCYRSADVFVFASNTETQGLVLLEALASGTPVVSTAVLGSRAVLTGARGAIVVDEDPVRFSGAVVDVLCDAALRRALREEARSYVVADWSGRAMAERLLDVYHMLIDGERAAAQRGGTVTARGV